MANLADQLSHPVFATISEVSGKLGLETYVVGGFVRDLILKRPCKDIDFVCVGSGISLAEAAAKAINPRINVSVFKNFGTAHFHYEDYDLEFVGARRESYNRDSRKPVVEEGTLSDDQNRRDFTINAMAISLNRDNYGELIAPFNGLDDLDNGIIRTPLDADITFSDDPLRMMRAIRFATQLNFYIEAKTLEAIARNKDRIRIISQERITDELNKIILAKKPSVGFRLLEETGLLAIILPEMQKLKGVQTVDDKSHKDNFYHTLQVLDNITFSTTDLWLRWAAILHDIAKPATKRFEEGTGWTFHGHEVVGSKWVPRIFRNLKLPMGGEMKFVQKMVYLHLRPIALTKEEISDSALRRLLFEAGDDIESLMKLCEADITSKNKTKVTRYLQRFEMVRQKLKDVEERDSIRNFQPPVSGELIMETFGIGPSREVGTIKDAIKEAILEGEIKNDYDQAYAMMLRLGAGFGFGGKGEIVSVVASCDQPLLKKYQNVRKSEIRNPKSKIPHSEICGPTAVGKTALAIEVAKHFGTEILSADSRQFYREMSIGTAKPTESELAAVRHHFINNLSIHDEYTAGMYEREALAVFAKIFDKHDVAVMVGGSGLFIKAVCEGFDSFKEEEVSEAVKERIRLMPLEKMQAEVAKLDPEYFDKVDKQNPRRLQASPLEVIYGTGRKYSDQRTGTRAKRSFNIIKIGLELPREKLYDRINKRVDAMRKAGLWEEATALYPFRHLQTLQTVGYQEVFDCMDGKLSKSEAIDKIKQNSRNYAKRQMTWFKKDEEVSWFESAAAATQYLKECI